jgi:hypothetical protein
VEATEKIKKMLNSYFKYKNLMKGMNMSDVKITELISSMIKIWRLNYNQFLIFLCANTIVYCQKRREKVYIRVSLSKIWWNIAYNI